MIAYKISIWIEGDIRKEEYYSTTTKLRNRIKKLKLKPYFGGNGYDISPITIK